MLAVVLVVVGGFLYWIAASLDPDIGISGLRARTVARSAAHHLSSSPEVISAKVSYAYAASGYGPIAQVKARLKDETSVDQAAELLASTHQKADTSQVPLSATLSWKLNGSDITVNFSCDDSPDNIRATTQRELTLVGKAKSVTRGEPDGSIHATMEQSTPFPRLSQSQPAPTPTRHSPSTTGTSPTPPPKTAPTPTHLSPTSSPPPNRPAPPAPSSSAVTPCPSPA